VGKQAVAIAIGVFLFSPVSLGMVHTISIKMTDVQKSGDAFHTKCSVGSRHPNAVIPETIMK
jgi:hypothetical protein